MQLPTGLVVASLYPVRNGRSAAAAAPHPRAEGGDGDVVGPPIDVDHGVVAAVQAGDVESACAVLAHVPKVIVQIDQVQTLPHHVGGLEGTRA
jgi:hypothetical protein